MFRASLLTIIAFLAIPAVGQFSPTARANAQTPIEFQGAPAPANRTIPRTAGGQPDFGGFWAHSFITPIGRMEGATKLVLSDEEAKKLSSAWVAEANAPEAGHAVDPDFFVAGVDQLSRVNGEWRTSMIVTSTGEAPYTEAGKKLDSQRRSWNRQPADGPEMRGLFERCIVGIGSAPLTTVPATLVRQFVQTPSHLVIASDGNDTRVIGLNAAPRPQGILSQLGDSTAHWEGDVLVVQTTGMSGQVHRGIITRPQSRVIERFEMLGADEVLYRFTVEDTEIYSQPWHAEFVLHRSTEKLFEYACHEANYSMTNILQAGRVANAKAQMKEKAKAKAKRASAAGQ
jgi:hypothetical protein